MPRKAAAKGVKPTEVAEHNSENVHPNFQRETRSRKRKQVHPDPSQCIIPIMFPLHPTDVEHRLQVVRVF